MEFIYVFSVTKHEDIKGMFQVSVPTLDGLYFVGSKFTDRERASAFADDVANRKASCYENNWTVKVTKDALWNPWVGHKLKNMEAAL